MGVDEEVLTGMSGSLRDQPNEFIESRKELDAMLRASLSSHQSFFLATRSVRATTVVDRTRRTVRADGFQKPPVTAELFGAQARCNAEVAR
jgi:hypothetical protein